MAGLADFSGVRRRESAFLHSGAEFRFAHGGFAGDLALTVLYPDPVEARRSCSHAAAVNGRPCPYPIETYGYALAIQGTIASEAEPDLTTVLTVFDSDPVLWQKLCSAALQVLGLDDQAAECSGLAAWHRIYSVLARENSKSEAASQALGIAAAAIRDLSGDDASIGFDDSMVERALGNSEEAAR